MAYWTQVSNRCPLDYLFLYRKSMRIIQNTLKIEEKFSDIPNKFRVGPEKVGSEGFPETRQSFGGPN